MKCKVKKIEILNEQGFEKLIQTHDFERFICSCDGYSVTDNVVRMAIYSDCSLFDELAEQLNDSDTGYRMYGGTKAKKSYTAIEFYL